MKGKQDISKKYGDIKKENIKNSSTILKSKIQIRKKKIVEVKSKNQQRNLKNK